MLYERSDWRRKYPAPRLTLHSLRLVQRGPVSYQVTTTFGYRDLRLYAVHRMLFAVKAARLLSRRKISTKGSQDIAECSRASSISLGAGISRPLVGRDLFIPPQRNLKISARPPIR